MIKAGQNRKKETKPKYSDSQNYVYEGGPIST